MRTIKNYRSEIAFYWCTQIGFIIPEDDKVIKDLFKSYKRPIPHKHVTQWDIGYVLSFFSTGRFKDWKSHSAKDLTLKTVFLFALVSGKRRSEIHALSKSVRWIQGESRKVELRRISKTQLASDIGRLRPFTISFLDELAEPEGKGDKLLRPVRSLSESSQAIGRVQLGGPTEAVYSLSQRYVNGYSAHDNFGLHQRSDSVG